MSRSVGTIIIVIVSTDTHSGALVHVEAGGPGATGGQQPLAAGTEVATWSVAALPAPAWPSASPAFVNVTARAPVCPQVPTLSVLLQKYHRVISLDWNNIHNIYRVSWLRWLKQWVRRTESELYYGNFHIQLFA